MHDACMSNSKLVTLEAATSNQIHLATVPRFGGKRDVAQMVQMSIRSVDNFIAQGCPHLKLGKRRVRFDMSEVRHWLMENFRTQRRAPAKIHQNGGGQ